MNSNSKNSVNTSQNDIQDDQIQDPTKCAQCGKFPDDILMLACSHDLCLVCSALTYQEQNPDFQKTFLTCQICGEETQLDYSSVYELEKICMEQQSQQGNHQTNHKQSQQQQQKQQSILKKEQYKNIDNNQSVNNQQQQQQFHQQSVNNTQQKSPFRQPSSTHYQSQDIDITQNRNILQSQFVRDASSNKLAKIVQGFCDEHPDEEISYFCFDCKCNCICSECVIHGQHRNHQVQTIKKAYPQVKDLLQEYIGNLDLKTNQVQLKKEKFEYQKQDIKGQHEYNVQQVQNIFQLLRDCIDQKEQQILQSCELLQEGNIKDIEEFTSSLESKLNDLIETNKYINQNTTNHEYVNILNFYAANHNRLEQILENDEYEKKLLSEETNPNSLNTKDIEQQIVSICSQIQKIEGQIIIKNNNSNKKSFKNRSPLLQKYYKQEIQQQQQQQQQQQYDSNYIKSYINNHNIEKYQKSSQQEDLNSQYGNMEKSAYSQAQNQSRQKLRSYSNHTVLQNIDQNNQHIQNSLYKKQPFNNQQQQYEQYQQKQLSSGYKFLTQQDKNQYEQKLKSQFQKSHTNSNFSIQQLQQLQQQQQYDIDNDNDDENQYMASSMKQLHPSRKKHSYSRSIRTETYQ